jgi:hypothetical protein
MEPRPVDEAQTVPKPSFEWADYEAFAAGDGVEGWIAYLEGIAGRAAELEPSGFRAERNDEFERERMTVRAGRLGTSVVVRVSLGLSRPEPAMDRLVEAAASGLGGRPAYEYREHWHWFTWDVGDGVGG